MSKTDDKMYTVLICKDLEQLALKYGDEELLNALDEFLLRYDLVMTEGE